MKALVKKEAGKGMWLEDVPEPELGINDVLIKIRRTAICGTDMHIYNWDSWAQRPSRYPWWSGMNLSVRSSRSALMSTISAPARSYPERAMSFAGAVAIAWLDGDICVPTPVASVSIAPAPSPSTWRCPCPMCGSTPGYRPGCGRPL